MYILLPYLKNMRNYFYKKENMYLNRQTEKYNVSQITNNKSLINIINTELLLIMN